MTRKEFRRFISTSKSSSPKKMLVTGESVTDPTFAQTGRQMITNPLPIECRMKYPQGVPLDKDNPHNFKEYDKLYPDSFKAMREAKQDVDTTKSKLNEIEKKNKPQPQQ